MMKKERHCNSKRLIWIFSVLVLLYAVASVPHNAGAQVHKKVDEKGDTHFSDSTPPDKKVDALPETSVSGIGGTEPMASRRSAEPIPQPRGKKESAYLAERIKEYERKIGDCESRITEYEREIEKLRIKKVTMPLHDASHEQEGFHRGLRKSYDSIIRSYQDMIRDEKQRLNEYRLKTADLKKALRQARLTEKTTPPTEKQVEPVLYHGNTLSGIFHRPGCAYYNLKSCNATFRSREAAIKAGYRPCEICKP